MELNINSSVVSIEIKMDFDNYHNANSIEKIEQTKVDFDYNRFRDDLMSLQ